MKKKELLLENNRQQLEIERLEKLLDDKCDRCIARDKAEALQEVKEILTQEKILKLLSFAASCGSSLGSQEDVEALAKYLSDKLLEEINIKGE